MGWGDLYDCIVDGGFVLLVWGSSWGYGAIWWFVLAVKG